MIPLCFPQALSLGSKDGLRLEVLPYRPEVGKILDLSRVYLLLEETQKSIAVACRQSGLEQPLQLVPEIMQALPKGPVPLKDYWQKMEVRGKPEKLRVCLLNGGGGGLGDGIMFAPTLDILSTRLAAQSGVASIDLHVYSGMPDRTGAALAGMPRVKVLPLPLTLQQFSAYDLYADFSSMLADESFQSMHMTDFVLAKMGIEPTEVEDHLKDPHLAIPASPSPAVQVALAEARAKSGSRPLVAVIFTATRTRTMPEESAAALMRALSGDFQPVVILAPGIDGPGFVQRYSLGNTVVDLSAVSIDFACFIDLLAGMDAIISVDTSAVHIGAGLRKPTIGLFNSIDHRLRVRYSSTVKAIQLHYRGKDCQAPCGASKNRLYLDAQRADATSLRWEFGYACPESIDRQALINWISEKIREQEMALPGARIQVLEEIRLEASLRFTKAPAPCWKVLKIDEIIGLLKQVMAEVKG